MFSYVATIYPRRLWAARKKRGVNRKKLAALLGHTTTSQLSRWERGAQIPTLPNALLLGYLLQVPVEILFEELRNELIQHLHTSEALAQEHECILGETTEEASVC